MQCVQCQKETSNPKFCSRSCSAKHSNSIKPKRSKTNNCKLCNLSIGYKRKYCETCRPKIGTDFKLSEINQRYSKFHRSSAFAVIRTRARVIADGLGWKSCRKCGYDKHIEIAHIKGIASYPDNTLVSEINQVSNLIPLCPNCHWEFDN